jgi:hypothetical protein
MQFKFLNPKNRFKVMNNSTVKANKVKVMDNLPVLKIISHSLQQAQAAFQNNAT